MSTSENVGKIIKRFNWGKLYERVNASEELLVELILHFGEKQSTESAEVCQ